MHKIHFFLFCISYFKAFLFNNKNLKVYFILNNQVESKRYMNKQIESTAVTISSFHYLTLYSFIT